MNNPQLLIDAIVQQTMVFIAQLATAGGIRAPLAGVATQVFADLTDELERQGVSKKVIAGVEAAWTLAASGEVGHPCVVREPLVGKQGARNVAL